MPPYSTHADYWAAQAPWQQEKLDEIRNALVRATEGLEPSLIPCISYGMPAFRKGPKGPVLVYFAVYAHHLGFYPTGQGIAAFEGQLGPWKYSKGAIQFPHDQPLPIALIAQITRYRWDTTA